MMDPRYRDITRQQIPEVELDSGVTVRIICGQVDGVKGPVQDVVIDPEYLDVQVPPGAEFKYPVQAGHTVFAYVITGKGCFEPARDPYGFEVEGRNYFDFKRDYLIAPESLVIFGDGDELNILTEDDGVRFLLISGKPIGEPVAWHGPIVMNTQEELRVAFDEYQRGTFLKVTG
jgi:redox-sensitive bicupin YhaK (pirin superfamily)